MFDHLNARDGQGRPGRDRAPNAPADVPSLVDREVSLDPDRPLAALHAWLDDAAPVSAVRNSPGARHVEFWSRMNVEAERRRQVRTPVHVQQRIMEALPTAAPGTVAPWWRRPITVSPFLAFAAAAGLLMLGAALVSTLRGR